MAMTITTVQLVPPAVFPIDLAIARQYARIGTTFDDNILTEIIMPAAVDTTERYLNRALITRTIQMTISEVVPKSDWPIVGVPFTVLPLAIEYALANQQTTAIPLLYAPVSNVIQVQYGIFGQEDTILNSTTDYQVDLLTEPARIHVQPTVPWYQTNHFSIIYEAGYGANAAAIPYNLQAALYVMTTHLYNNRGGSNLEIPEAFYTLARPFKQDYFPSTT